MPHRDTPDLLGSLLSTVPRRSDVEVVVVDDHSASGLSATGELCALLSPARLRVEALTSAAEGRGSGYARNVGMHLAEGRWLCFADADDLFTPVFEGIVTRHASEAADVVYFDAESRDLATGSPAARAAHLSRYIKEYSLGDGRLGERHLRLCFGEPWCRLIRREWAVAAGLSFDTSVSMHQDTRFSYRLGLSARRVAVDTAVGYCVTARRDSLSQGRRPAQLLDRVRVFSLRERELREAGQLDLDGYNRWHYDQTADLLIAGELDLYRQALAILRANGIGTWRLLTHLSAKKLVKMALSWCRML